MFLYLHPEWSGSVRDLATETDEYFKTVKGVLLLVPLVWIFRTIFALKHVCVCENAFDRKCYFHTANGAGESFLLHTEGRIFEHVLRVLRFHHIINDAASLKVIENDRIIPDSEFFVLSFLVASSRWKSKCTERKQESTSIDARNQRATISVLLGRAAENECEPCRGGRYCRRPQRDPHPPLNMAARPRCCSAPQFLAAITTITKNMKGNLFRPGATRSGRPCRILYVSSSWGPSQPGRGQPRGGRVCFCVVMQAG